MGTSFPQTEEIIENGIVNGISATDVQKILNLKHAWEFILDQDVLQSETIVKEQIDMIVRQEKSISYFCQSLSDCAWDGLSGDTGYRSSNV